MTTSPSPIAPPAPRERMLHVVQGEYAVVSEPGVVLTTILGSCVATCMWDPVAEVGGMNHFLLPGDASNGGESLKYGVNSMELLINGMLQRGAVRRRMQAKLFGGARVVPGLSDVGAQNAAFALDFLRLECIPCVGQSLGGDQARRIRFWPATGRVAQMLVETTETILEVERKRPAAAIRPQDPAAGSVELF
ncbi:MAG: chemotaxis protein CheD [Hyphomonadaceae bacterium]|nr:chemotaxis protein CheD [Hyphomonadaceae bacterium]